MRKDDLARLQLLVQERRLRMEELSTLYRQTVSAHREAFVLYIHKIRVDVILSSVTGFV